MTLKEFNDTRPHLRGLLVNLVETGRKTMTAHEFERTFGTAELSYLNEFDKAMYAIYREVTG